MRAKDTLGLTPSDLAKQQAHADMVKVKLLEDAVKQPSHAAIVTDESKYSGPPQVGGWPTLQLRIARQCTLDHVF